jgi:hypothetical protein
MSKRDNPLVQSDDHETAENKIKVRKISIKFPNFSFFSNFKIFLIFLQLFQILNFFHKIF